MKSLWNEQEASACAGDDLAMRVYTSRLLGADENLVMHGGGNTSVKSTTTDFFGREVDVLYVKGSGWDLGSIEKPGFAPLRLNETQLLAERETLSDPDMATQLRALMLDQSAPSPSVEAILHAIMPFKYVDHTHTDAVVTLTNNPAGEDIIRELYPDCLVLPYIMPGFILSKQVYDALQQHDIAQYKGIILMHHGVFTYDDDARTAYENMIELVDRADAYISRHADPQIQPAGSAPDLLDGKPSDLLHLAKIRKAVSKVRGSAQIAVLNSTPAAAVFAGREDVATISDRGPITPDHVIRTKRTAAICHAESSDDIPEIQAFADDYQSYFEQYNDGTLTMLDPAPRWAVWKDNGTIAFGSNLKECEIITDITRHTAWTIQTGESLGGWQALPAQDIFDLEYWILEQAKLKKPAGQVKPHLGKIALVTGAAGGIGHATALQLHADGAVVVGLDINPSVSTALNAPGLTGIQCDLTDEAALLKAIQQIISLYGGLDIVVANAGIFQSGELIDQLGDSWDRHIDINLSATQRLFKHTIPYLKLGIEASIIVIGSRNVTAPGAGASAYSVSKAGLTQLARVAALELAPHGVRVNTLHPDAVFDTDLWTDEALEKSAARYGLSVQEYKTKNLLSTEITSGGVAGLVSTLASPTFSATTGAQIPVDGGNDRVI